MELDLRELFAAKALDFQLNALDQHSHQDYVDACALQAVSKAFP
jgi:hypothetical protein